MKRRLVPRMLTLPFVTEPSASVFLPYLFTPKEPEATPETPTKKSLAVLGLLGDEDYQFYVVPFIRKCFTSRNRSLRVRVLQHIEYYMWELPTEYVLGDLLDEVFLSLKDNNDDLVMFTMNALVLISKYLIKLDEQTKKQELDIGSSIINHRIIRKLHHFACVETTLSVRSHALLCLMELWNVPKVCKLFSN